MNDEYLDIRVFAFDICFQIGQIYGVKIQEI